MAGYLFYAETYKGNSIPESEFPRLETRASAQLSRYKRIYQVTGDTQGEAMAVCAMADALYFFETAQNSPVSSSVGSVSSSNRQTDISPKAQSAELYRCASLYLDIYRG